MSLSFVSQNKLIKKLKLLGFWLLARFCDCGNNFKLINLLILLIDYWLFFGLSPYNTERRQNQLQLTVSINNGCSLLKGLEMMCYMKPSRLWKSTDKMNRIYACYIFKYFTSLYTCIWFILSCHNKSKSLTPTMLTLVATHLLVPFPWYVGQRTINDEQSVDSYRGVTSKQKKREKEESGLIIVLMLKGKVVKVEWADIKICLSPH